MADNNVVKELVAKIEEKYSIYYIGGNFCISNEGMKLYAALDERGAFFNNVKSRKIKPDKILEFIGKYFTNVTKIFDHSSYREDSTDPLENNVVIISGEHPGKFEMKHNFCGKIYKVDIYCSDEGFFFNGNIFDKLSDMIEYFVMYCSKIKELSEQIKNSSGYQLVEWDRSYTIFTDSDNFNIDIDKSGKYLVFAPTIGYTEGIDTVDEVIKYMGIK